MSKTSINWRAMWAACCATVLAMTGAWAAGGADVGALRLVVVPERTYVEDCFEQLGLYDRVSLHFVVLNDTPEALDLEGVSFSFQGKEGCGFEVTLSREALIQRLRECASMVFVAPEVRERRGLATELPLPAGGAAALIGNQFCIPAAMRAEEAVVEVRARDGQGEDRSVRERIKLWRYEPSMRFQFPFEGVWQVCNGHGPGMGHAVDSFAYDFIKVEGISAYEGDGSKLEQWRGYGEPIVAAADGVVVEANQAEGQQDRDPNSPPPSAEEMGLKTEITNTLVTIAEDGVHYRPGNVDWEALSAEQIAAINGAYVVIRHGEEEFSFYVHMQPGSLTVKPGDEVKAGQAIGKCGSAGHAKGAGLHFQLLYGPDLHLGLPVAFTAAELPEMSPIRLQVFGTYGN